MMDSRNPGRSVENSEVAGPGTVAAVFKDHAVAERAASDLMSAGFSKSDIGIAVCQPEGRNIDEGWMSRVRNMLSSGDREEYSSTDAPETFREMGISDDRTRHFERAMHEGDVLVTVKAAGRQQDAINILNRYGGQFGIQDRARSESDTNLRSRGIGNNAELPERRIQLFGETLRVHKERIQRGEVRLRKEVVTEQKTVNVPVMREEVVIERVPADKTQPAHAAELGSDREIRIPLSEERVHVEKTPVVNEEIRVGKRQVQDVKHVSDTVRHEEVHVDNDGDVNVSESGREMNRDDLRRTGKDKKVA